MAHLLNLNPAQQQQFVIQVYNTIVNGEADDPLQLLRNTIHSIQCSEIKIAEISLLYCLESDHLIDQGFYDDAYKLIMNAVKLDSERKEVLQSLLSVHTPRTSLNKSNLSRNPNPYENEEKTKEYASKLENLYSNDPSALLIVGQTYSILGKYNDALRVLKKAFFIIFKHNNNQSSEMAYGKSLFEEIKKKVTQTYIDRYSNCPNESHEIIIKYLIELIEWKFNDFNASNLETCIEEIWERMEYVMNKTDVNNWDKIQNLLLTIPCSIPLSVFLLNLICNTFKIYKQYYFGIQFFSRLISEYQTYNDNMLEFHAKFEKYYILYLHRAKLYKVMGKSDEMFEDINACNTRLLSEKPEIQRVTVQNVLEYEIKAKSEKPVIETVQQIKKRRASRSSTFSISPMPKQYRDFHLTPKKGAKKRELKRKRYSMNQVDQIQVRDDKKESETQNHEFVEIQSKNRLLENRIVDLKNDLHRVQSRYKNDIANLKEQIAKNAHFHMTNNNSGNTLVRDGEKDYSELRLENQKNLKMIQSLQRQITILKDCKMKTSALKNKTKPKKARISVCGCIGKLIETFIFLCVFVIVIIYCSDWMVTN